MAYKAHKHAKLRVFRMLSSQYGCTDASMRWYNTLLPYLQSQGFQRGENDKCIFVHPETKIRIAIHVDEYLVRGVRSRTEEFFKGLCEHLAHKPPVFLDDEGNI